MADIQSILPFDHEYTNNNIFYDCLAWLFLTRSAEIFLKPKRGSIDPSDYSRTTYIHKFKHTRLDWASDRARDGRKRRVKGGVRGVGY